MITSMSLLLSIAPAAWAESSPSSVVQDVSNTLNLDPKVTEQLTDAITALAGTQRFNSHQQTLHLMIGL